MKKTETEKGKDCWWRDSLEWLDGEVLKTIVLCFIDINDFVFYEKFREGDKENEAEYRLSFLLETIKPSQTMNVTLAFVIHRQKG